MLIFGSKFVNCGAEKSPGSPNLLAQKYWAKGRIPRSVGACAWNWQGVGRLRREVLGEVRALLEGGEGARGRAVDDGQRRRADVAHQPRDLPPRQMGVSTRARGRRAYSELPACLGAVASRWDVAEGGGWWVGSNTAAEAGGKATNTAEAGGRAAQTVSRNVAVKSSQWTCLLRQGTALQCSGSAA